jgi:aspartyl protease family protein
MKFHHMRALLAVLLALPAPLALADTARLQASENGHFVTKAEINGRSIRVMVDTGASTVALSHEDARKVGFRPDDLDFDVPVATANGVVKAAAVTIERVEVGGVTIEKVKGMVLPKGAMSGTLLGMSFLSRLDSFEVKDGVLLLRN